MFTWVFATYRELEQEETFSEHKRLDSYLQLAVEHVHFEEPTPTNPSNIGHDRTRVMNPCYEIFQSLACIIKTNKTIDGCEIRDVLVIHRKIIAKKCLKCLQCIDKRNLENPTSRRRCTMPSIVSWIMPQRKVKASTSSIFFLFMFTSFSDANNSRDFIVI